MKLLSRLKSILFSEEMDQDFELDLNLESVASTQEIERLDLDIEANIPVTNSSSSTNFDAYSIGDIDE